MRNLSLVLLWLTACQPTGANLTDCGQSEDLIQAEPDLAESTPVDAAMHRPDLTLCESTSIPCAGTGTVCNQDQQCNPCGGDGQECCSTKFADRVCNNGLYCTGCSQQSWGKFSRCQPSLCGQIGKSCCWKWPEPCGSGGAHEWCIQGACIEHVCQGK